MIEKAPCSREYSIQYGIVAVVKYTGSKSYYLENVSKMINLTKLLKIGIGKNKIECQLNLDLTIKVTGYKGKA